MQHQVLPLFSTPIFLTEMKIDKHLKDKFKLLPYDRLDINNGWMSKDNYVLDNIDFKEVKDSILDIVNFYLKNVLLVDPELEFYITNSWVTVHERNDSAQMHSHANSLFSGTYYIDQAEDDNTELVFSCKDRHRLFPSAITPNYIDYNLLNSNMYRIKTNTNNLILFPSHMNHATTQCTSNIKRYCLAFNVFVRGNLTANKVGSINLK